MKIKDYATKYNEIAGNLMVSFAETKKGENIVFSPLSFIVLLSIAADAVSGKTRDEIIDVIGCGKRYDELMDVISKIQANFEESGSIMSSNAVCVKDIISESIRDGYEERLKNIFDGKIFISKDIVRDVNIWVKDKTKGMIVNAVDESANQMMAFLINAIAFESEWMEQYEEYEIQIGKFNNADGTVSEVQMLNSMEDGYIENDFFTGFLKPYKDEKYAFMALLPKKKSSLFMLRGIKQIDYSRLFNEVKKGIVHVTMPEFKYDFGENLTELCKKWEINTLFTSDSDFSPMSSKRLMMDSIIHKAHIEVDRNGTKAAAATIAYVAAGCAPNVEFKAVRLDRPFVYAILDTETGVPIFAGLFSQVDK